LTVYSQPGIPNDTTRVVSVPAWQMYRLIHDVKQFHVCENLSKIQAEKLDIADSLLSLHEGRIVVLQEKNKLKQLEVDLFKKETKITKDYYKEELKTQKKKYFKVVLVAIVEGVLIVLLILNQ
jgi:hypothetical protein